MSKKVGLLGGSFNPAHAGHLYICKQALKILHLDEIWLLVSPQNPNKPTENMATFEERYDSAISITKNEENIIVSDFEKQNGTSYTFASLTALKNDYANNNFVWLMGADNLVSFHSWYSWQEILQLIPIAVFDRDNLKEQALKSPAAKYYSNNMISTNDASKLVYMPPPAWVFLDIQQHPESSTNIRTNN